MITYLPFASFRTSATVLDDRRLGLQRIDNIRVLEALSGRALVHSSQWKDDMTGRLVTDHWAEGEWYVQERLAGYRPVTELWKNHESLFFLYNAVVCAVWKERGFKDGCQVKFERLWNECYDGVDDDLPDWFDDTMFHWSMQALLIEKAPHIYKDKFPGLLEEVKPWAPQRKR